LPKTTGRRRATKVAPPRRRFTAQPLKILSFLESATDSCTISSHTILLRV
jgi:hypothetical protein